MIHPRPTPLHPPISSAAELDAYIERRVRALDADCYDGETIQSIGQSAHHRSLGATGALRDLRGFIAEWVAEEAADTAADAEYDRWKDAYGDDSDKLAAYQAEGR